MKWTEAQQQTIDTRDKNILVSAAAGSGKTAVLVERVITKLCDKKNPIRADELLIVTFTNAAAAEMRTRIEKRIEDKEVENTQEELVDENMLASSIPDVDSYVDNIVKKTYEKNEQFSSVYVGDNTSTVKLDKVLDKLNIDEDIKKEIVPEEEKSTPKEEIKEEKETIENIDRVEEQDEIKSLDSLKETLEEQKEEVKESTSVESTNSSLDNLKAALEEKKKEMDLKQDDLKNKLDMLKKMKENK